MILFLFSCLAMVLGGKPAKDQVIFAALMAVLLLF